MDAFEFGAFVVEVATLEGTPAFALGDGTVRFARRDGVEVRPTHAGAILKAVASADGKQLFTGGDDGKVIASGLNGTATTIGAYPRKWIGEVAAGLSGALAFSVGKDVVVRTAPGRERTFSLARAAGGLAFAPKGQRIAIARYDGITLYFTGTEAPGLDLNWKGAHIGVTFSPDGRYVVSAMQENALHGWRLEDGLNLRMTGYPAKPRSFSWSSKGRYLATSGSDSAVLWPFHFKDGPQGKTPMQVGRRSAFVTRVAFHPRHDAVAIGYDDGAVAVGFMDEPSTAMVEAAGDSPISALGWNGRGDRLLFGTEAGKAAIVEFPL